VQGGWGHRREQAEVNNWGAGMFSYAGLGIGNIAQCVLYLRE